MKTIEKQLEKLNACRPARKWAKGKSWQEIYNTCHRGDWLLWLYAMTREDNEDTLRLLTLAKARCAATVKHLMKDERSIKALEVAEAYGLGKVSREELDAAATDSRAAYAAAAGVAADAAAAAADADATVAYVADAAANAADAAYIAAREAAATDSRAAANAAYAKNQQETADIVRKTIPIQLWVGIEFDN